MTNKNILWILMCALMYIHGYALETIDVDTCSPNFKEIYDFQVGDVFQYVQESSSSAGGAVPTTRIITKYTITAKQIHGDSLMYTISGIERTKFWCAGNPTPDPSCALQISSKPIEATLLYIDSVNHFLNACPPEIVNNFLDKPFLWLEDQPELGKLYTKVFIETNDTNLSKRIGGAENLFFLNEEDSLVEVQEVNYQATYAKHLGKIEFDFWYFEANESGYLQGYVKNGDTAGIVTPDDELITAISETPASLKQFIYPNPTSGKLLIIGPVAEKNRITLTIYSLTGSILVSKSSRNGSVDISELPNGMYIYQIKTETNKPITGKLIKSL